ncbi:hydrophobic/amphiphilic exporter-1, HAE1 family [Filimonas lacunae]|uniref:Hydrophobic/amphiphilic exporter-1, HAE1 family n=1 Tax=Filimonas lacunae TaxID=477680 RepID=A0A173MEW4_9BACT|nr:efflux RND transporter permease subunit [Filimonas lacunae]BAV05971.1 RND efflux system, inner membrane transporter CmeB [Filimonas lacunae]SIT23988.1 hydrophobic/amphiphilic exporter-1, HAE1 family [Filimonas lacunae]
MFSKFIHRPVFAIVISIVIVFMGTLAILKLPTSQFPDIAPTTVNIFIAYPGASADVLVQSTLITLENAINGVQDMRYMATDATSAGEATLRIIFEPGTDPNQAVIRVKTRVDQVMPLLPELVQREGVVITPIQPSMLMYVNLYAKDKNMDEKFLYNYANVKMLPEINRIKGVARSQILGSRTYAMRIWLNPDRMRAYNVSVDDVMKALGEQSIVGRPGRIGQSSGIKAQSLEYVLTYKGRFSEPEQYENVIVRANANGERIRLKDIGKAELGSEFFDIYSNLDGHPSASIVLKQNYGSNANEVIESVKKKLEEMKETFPPGLDYKISYDVSKFLDASIEQVIDTLRDAFILVAIVVFIFLGDWRSTLIPILAVPVSLVGAFFVIQFFGITINLVTLFALVLAIGIVVDDAIVVVEAVHAKFEEHPHISPYRAVKMVLGEISGAIIAITAVMVSVFIPISFMSGPVGTFYRQFSITMASSIVISAIIALTLTPVLCAMLLKNHHGHPKKKNLFTRALDSFNRGFDKMTGGYVSILKRIVNRRWVTFIVLIAFCAGTYFVNKSLPSGFIPIEDQGTIYAIIQTPPGSTLETTNEVSRRLQKICEEVDGVESVSSLAGYEIMTEGRGSNAGTCLINLKSWGERKHKVTEIMKELEEKSKDLGAKIEFFEPPAIPGFGASGGFSMRLLDKNTTTDYQDFDKVQKAFMEELAKHKELTGLFSFFAANYPQYELEVDNDLAMQKGVSIGKAMENLDIMIGSTYEQGFIKFNRFFKVYVQSDPQFRRLPSDILNLYVKNDQGEMVPYSAFMKLRKTQGPNEITRYNMYNSAAIQGLPAEGYTTADAIAAVKEVAKKLPKGYDIAWEGLSFDEANKGNEAIYIFAIVLIFVYFVLAAQYESFIIPLAVIISLPVGIFGTFFFLKMMGLENNIYAQVGLIMLVGLLGKNAVLIVEFAVQKRSEGLTITEAAIEGAKVRFRPILMTSFAFIAGLIPLVIAKGAGAIGNRTLGGAALGGMLFGTVFGVIIVPGLYYIFGSLANGRKLIKFEEETSLSEGFVHQIDDFSHNEEGE